MLSSVRVINGRCPRFALLINSEVDSMGGVVDWGAGLDAKSSPRHAAILKAHEELRLEYDVREEQRRELEFLEKGGNPLDYIFGHAASISRQSTSLTDQLAEQYMISEAKGRFALAASPHGDSVESSGRPGVSMGREPNIADNLLLFVGENSDPGRGKTVKRAGRRCNIGLLEQFSQIDGFCNTKESFSENFLHGQRGQAYARRNQTRSSRHSHSNKSPFLQSSCNDVRNCKVSKLEVHAEEHAISSISNSRPASPNVKSMPKSFSSKNQLDMELDGGQTHRLHSETEKAVFHVAETNSPEEVKNIDHNTAPVKQAAIAQSSDLLVKETTASVGSLPVPPCAMDDNKVTNNDENNVFRALGVDFMHAHDDNTINEENVTDIIIELVGVKNVIIDPSCVSTSHLHGNANGGESLSFRTVGSLDTKSKEHALCQNAACQGTFDDTCARENRQIACDPAHISNNEARNFEAKLNNSAVQFEDVMHLCDRIDDQADKRPLSNIEIEISKESEISNDDSSFAVKAGLIVDNSIGNSHESSWSILSKKVSSNAPELQNREANQLKLSKKMHEDTMLKEARIIEESLRCAGVLTTSCISSEKRQKCHWDFVLEEMAWMANDFMQERLWKTTAAAKVCHQIASICSSKFEHNFFCKNQRNIARTLAKAVMKFWCSVDTIRTRGEASSDRNEHCDANLLKESNTSSFDTTEGQCVENCGLLQPGIQRYALRLLQHISKMSNDPVPVEAPRTPDRINDAGTFGISCDDLSEESLLYNVPPGAMHAYRESVESKWAHYKKMGNNLQEECEASACDSVAGNSFEEGEGEIGVDIFTGAFEGKFSSKVTHMKKNSHKSYTTRHEVGTDLSYEPYLDEKPAGHSILIMGKRPSSTLPVRSVPTKRTRTAARQHLIIPLNVGVAGPLPVASKTDVSSGDTSSFQDEQSTLHGASQPRLNSEAESTMDFESLLPLGNRDVPLKQKMKKKPKHLGYINSLNLIDSRIPGGSRKASSYGQRLQTDYMVQQHQRYHTKRRFEIHQLESNGNAGFYGQNVAKKPKLSKLAESPEMMIPAGGFMPSPVASQMSNMSNSNTLIRIINNRDRRRKSKGLKMTSGQFGSGVPWSTFEDQALVVLVHDMGLNWELVTDVLNSTLHLKCIYRKPKDCKERHKFLVDKSACEGADNAEDSGSSQPYPSTLPGIPKGSARQLFQRLQGPMEEDTLKSHFEKIIIIGQHLQYFQAQDVNQEQKQIAPAHGSHAFAVSQACPNNLPGTVLSPLDLCEAVNASPDALGTGYQGSHKSGNVIPGQQGSLAPAFPTATNTMLEGSTVVLGNILPSLSPPVNNTPPRDAQRHDVPRSATFPVDDQHRLQQYSQMFSGRKPQSSISIPGALAAGVDRSVGMLHCVNSMGMMCGVNKSMSISRAGFQGICPSGMFNMVSPNNILSSNGVAMPNPVTTHSTSVSSPGNTTLRPRDAVQILRPSQSTEEHRHSMMQEIQLQVSIGNAQATTPFTGVSSSFSNAPIPPVQRQLHQSPQQPHVLGKPNHSNIQVTNHSSTQQQAYIRFAKEKKFQQRIVPQAQQYPGSSTLPPMQNNSHFQQQCQSSSPVNSFVSAQPQHKQQPMPCNPQTSSTMSTKILKQRRRQQVPQQRQQPSNLQQQKPQAQQQAKFVKDLGQEAMLLHHNLSVDASQVGGLPTGPKNQASEKHLMQKNQRLVSSSTGLNSNLQHLNQQKLYSHHLQQSMQVSVMSSEPDHNQTSMQSLSSDAILATRKSDASSLLVTQKQQQQLQENQSMSNMQRIMLQQNLQLNPDGRRQSTNVPFQANQMIPSTSLPQISDASSLPVVSSGVQWKLEPTFETHTMVEKTQLATLPCENFTGNDAVIPSSSQGLIQRQLSGNISIHGHGVGGHWQQKQLLQSQLPPQKQGVQGNLYAESSNTRPG